MDEVTEPSHIRKGMDMVIMNVTPVPGYGDAQHFEVRLRKRRASNPQ